MPVIFISLFYAAASGLFAILAGHAIEKRDYRSAGLWLITALALVINGALHVNRHFMGIL